MKRQAADDLHAHAGKSAASVRFDALTCVYTMLRKRRVTAESLRPLLVSDSQFVPLIIQCMDEDWYSDTRYLACCTMIELLSVAGADIDDAGRRQIYPELTKRMDDSSNAVRTACAAAIGAFARHAMPCSYCDTNSGYVIRRSIAYVNFCIACGKQPVAIKLTERTFPVVPGTSLLHSSSILTMGTGKCRMQCSLAF
jgi:hypothetical protein